MYFFNDRFNTSFFCRYISVEYIITQKPPTKNKTNTKPPTKNKNKKPTHYGIIFTDIKDNVNKNK